MSWNPLPFALSLSCDSGRTGCDRETTQGAEGRRHGTSYVAHRRAWACYSASESQGEYVKVWVLFLPPFVVQIWGRRITDDIHFVFITSREAFGCRILFPETDYSEWV